MIFKRYVLSFVGFMRDPSYVSSDLSHTPTAESSFITPLKTSFARYNLIVLIAVRSSSSFSSRTSQPITYLPFTKSYVIGVKPTSTSLSMHRLKSFWLLNTS